MLSYNYYFIGGGNTIQWTELRHNGPMFPPEFKPPNIPVIINNKEVILDPIGQEYAMMYAKYLDTKYIELNVFKKNFWKDFKLYAKTDSLDNIDFSLIKKYLDEQKEKIKNLNKEEKNKIKENMKSLEEPFKFCVIDGAQQNVGNYKIEPPGIFIGRGNHPKLGRIKKRIYPEDITLNLDKEAPIPKPLEGHKWGGIVHDKSVIWLATWIEEITNKNKYILKKKQ